MDDLISRQAAIDALDCINGAEEVLKALPPAKPEQKTGMWFIRKWGGDAKCSNCGYRFNDVYDTEHHDRYCRFCGSEMIGVKGTHDK